MRTAAARTATALVAVTLSTIGCSPRHAEYRAPGGTPVVLISVDTLRSDRLPAYGYDGVEAPAIDSLRRDGILFERAYTHVPLTLPAHVSLLSGLRPPKHGVRDNLGYTVDTDRAPLLQQSLQEGGYATGAGVSAFVLRGATGLDIGFDFYEDGFELEPAAGSAGVQAVQRAGGETLGAVRPWLRSVAAGPFFLFFHIFEPHTPYEPPAEFAARYPSPYDGEVAAADAVVGDLLDELRELGRYDEALIVFLSDHGEGLGDHGEDEHGLFLYRSTLQVPLILKLPGAAMAGATVARPVQLIDVVPTLVAALRLPRGENAEGSSLLAGPHRETDTKIYAETLYPRFHFGWSDLAALIVGPYHYIDAPQPELYDLLSDPDETNNLMGSKPELESELEAALSALARPFEVPAATDPETRRRLRALGYVGEATITDADVLPDPKARVETLTEIRRAHRLFADGELEAAAAAFRDIVDRDPGIEDAWDYLALSQLGLGRLEEAAATYGAALEHVPHSMRLSLRAAECLHRLGHLDEAAVRAEDAMVYDPGAAHVLLAQIAFERGDLEGAEAEARAALSVDGDRRPGARLIMADILNARGQTDEAVRLLSQTLEDGITDESVRSKLAMTYLRIGELDRADQALRGFEDSENTGILLAIGKLAMSRRQWSGARRSLERALLSNPTDATLKLNLGLVAMGEGNLGEAVAFLEEAVSGNPGSFDGWNALGSVHARRADTVKAIAAWERAHEIKPEVLDVVYNLGLANVRAGRPSRAVGYLEDYAARAEPGPRRDQAVAMVGEMRAKASQSR